MVFYLTILSSGVSIPVSHLTSPITFMVPVASRTSGMNTGCSYFNITTNRWQSHGMIVSQLRIINGVEYIVCETTHLTDFSTVAESATPVLNTVDPIGDASLLFNYDPSNMKTPVVLGLILLSFMGVFFVCASLDKKQETKLLEYKLHVFLKRGKIQTKGEHEEQDPTVTKSAIV